ncbi:MAG TPA: glycosyltransferase family 39 protein [Ignavibacteria bacterium]
MSKRKKNKIYYKSKTSSNYNNKLLDLLTNKEQVNSQNLILIILIIFILIGLLLRIINISQLWINEDEAYTMTAAKKLITGTGSEYQTSFLFTLLQYIFFLSLGINELSARLPSALFGVICIIFNYFFLKKNTNKTIALFTSILLSVSFFEVFFSRTARPYTALQFSYLILSLFLLKSINTNYVIDKSLYKDFLNFLSLKHFIIFILLFIISILIHPWVVLFWITAIFYFFIMFFYHFTYDKKNKNLKYYFLFLGFIFIFVVLFGWLLIESNLFVEFFQQKGTIDVVSPNIKRTIDFLKDDPFKGVKHYFKLFNYDFNYLWIFALLGFILSFFIIENKKFLFFLHSMFFSNLIILGFFIHVLQQRYFFPIYPFYLTYIAIGLFFLFLLIKKFFSFLNKNALDIISFTTILIIISLTIPYKDYKNLFEIKMKKNIYLDANIGEYTFYPYRHACQYVNDNIKEGEDVICLMPRIAEFYIDRNIYGLRQVIVNLNKFNVADELVKDTTLYPNSMINHRSFLNFLKEHKSGWIIADARINTTLTPETRSFILSHFDFHFLGSQPLSVMLVGHWDSTTLYKHPKYFWSFHEYSPEANLPYPINVPSDQIIKLSLIYSGVEKENEALTIIGKLSSYLPPNRNLVVPDTADWVMKADELVKTQSIDFIYNPLCGDSLKGFMIHNIITLLGK